MTTALTTSLGEANFRRHRYEVFVRTDRMFAWVMGVQYALAVASALATHARTWSGGSSSVHPHVWIAVLLGGALAVGPILLVRRAPGETSTRMFVAVAQGLFSALLIHLTDGRIETHFHVFGSLALLAIYRDWRVLAVNSAVVALDHAVRGALFPTTLYGVGYGVEWRFVEHAGWILFEDAFLFVAGAYTIREMRATAERQAEIDRQSAVLESVLTGMRDGVLVVGPQGEVLHANPAVESILGVRAHDAPFADWSRRLGFVDYGCASRRTETLPLIRALRGESLYGEQYEVEHGVTSETVWLEVGAEPLQGVGGERIGGVAVFRDVTERRRILAETELARDEARRANCAKSELLSRTSHELRTPLNAIVGFAQTLGMEELGPEARSDLAEIERAGKRLLGLVNEVLDLASLEARGGVEAASMGAVSPIEVLTRIADGLRTEMDAKGVRMKIDGQDEALRIWADQGAFEKALRNVVANAVQYNRPKGEIRVRVERSGGGMVALSVADEGAGMAPEGVARLFTPFDRLGAEPTGYGGAGLGLAIAQGLVESMGGQIQVRSEVGLGTTVTLLLPAVESMAVAA